MAKGIVVGEEEEGEMVTEEAMADQEEGEVEDVGDRRMQRFHLCVKSSMRDD